MPTYMDIHELPEGVTAEDVAKAHSHDVEVQGKYGVKYSKYWINESARKVFCLCHAPDSEAAIQVHREAHGLEANKLIRIEPEMAELFLGSGEINPGGAVLLPGAGADDRDPGIRTILFTDMVNSTMLTQQLGDDAAMELVRLHDDIVRHALQETGGREVKHTGDGIMASFVSAAGAVRCASRIQSELNAREKSGAEKRVKIRIGLAAGEPVEHHEDLFGSTVQLAARLCACAQPDQILASNVVAELCLGKGLRFADPQDVSLKGFEQPVCVRPVSWVEA